MKIISALACLSLASCGPSAHEKWLAERKADDLEQRHKHEIEAAEQRGRERERYNWTERERLRQQYPATNYTPNTGPTVAQQAAAKRKALLEAPVQPAPHPEAERIKKEVAETMAGEHGKLPAAVRRGFASGKVTEIVAANDTSYTLTIQMSGATPQELVIPAGKSKSISLSSGAYSVSAKVNDPSVIPFAGTENFAGGAYDYRFFIKTSFR